MNEALKIWWRARTEREQRLLLVMLALAALLLSWLLVVRPLGTSLDAAQARHEAAVTALAEARAQADEIRGLEAAGDAATPIPVDGFVSQSAAEAGFADARIESSGQSRATIAIAAARPQAFFAWVSRMEESGLVVEAMRAQANSDQTISAEATFRARGG